MKAVVSCGLGVDSTALLVLLARQQRRIDSIIFADTGGEKPETYHYKTILEKWLEAQNFPALVTVCNSRGRKGQIVDTLEQDCLVGGKLPDIAYGKKGCSIEWKQKPAQKWAKENLGEDLRWLISFNADEIRRKIPSENYEYPLIDAGWGRKKCIEEIVKAGLPIPPKSACFFCPSTKIPEIQSLARCHPDLAKRAIQIEKSAKRRNTGVKGLGRRFAWEPIINNELNTDWLLPPLDCSCLEAGVGIEEYWRQFGAVAV